LEFENIPAGVERNITIIASDYLPGIEVNDEIGIIFTTSLDFETRASDVGFVHTIVNKPDIQIIDTVDSQIASYISANETGKILIKNTGDESITLDKLYLNTTTELNFASDVNFEFGDISLGIQECALVSFNITGFQLNSSNILNVKVTTNTTAQFDMDFTTIVDSRLYNINIDDTGTTASNTGNVVITIENNGIFNVTIDSVYVNNTFISLGNFIETNFEIGAGSSIQLTIAMTDLEIIIGSVDLGELLKILVRTKEGAEDIHEETVTP
jgi:archaellum component FlaG (FlaF/FlaG flagellin family)